MGFLIGLLTFILVVNCLVLMLLILIQLPKKEAGAGTAFGGGATDALFGAGTGNALTKMTKYAATLFFVLAIGLSLLNAHARHVNESGVREALQKQVTKIPPATPAPATPGPAGNPMTLAIPSAGTSNSLAAPKPGPASTNPAAAPAKSAK